LNNIIKSWFVNDEQEIKQNDPKANKIDLKRILPYIAIHLGILAVFWVGVSWVAATLCFMLYFARMFFITGFFHRYFSHKTYQVGRKTQFIMAFLGSTAVQRGPIWWASHHRHHHSHSDMPDDVHSPHQHSFLWAHTLWFLSNRNFQIQKKYVRDLLRFPELVWLDKLDILPPLILALSTFAFGVWIDRLFPELGTNGWQCFIWGFVISTVFCYHATYTINSLSHLFGTRRFETTDHSRNNFLLAIITLGEGWHNNHHFYQSSTRQGFKWYEIDITYYILKAGSWFGIFKNLRPVPEAIARKL